MDWARFRRLVDDTVTRLRVADGDREKIEAAVRRYLDSGDRCGMSPATLWDHFVISSPGIPEQAGYCGSEQEQLAELFRRLSSAKYRDH